MIVTLVLFGWSILKTGVEGNTILCDVAYRRRTSSSSTYNELQINSDPVGYACNAVDGSLRTRYSSGSCMRTEAENYPWFTVDLDENYLIQNVSLYVRTDNPDSFYYKEADNIRINIDGTNCAFYNGPTTNMNAPISVTCKMEGRTVKITREVSNTFLGFCEIRVYALVYSTSCPLAPTSWHCPEIPPVTIDQKVYPTYNVGGTSTNIALTSQPSTFLDETSTSSISTPSPTTITNSISTDTNFDGTISTEKLPSSSNAPSAVATTTTDQCMCLCSNFHNTTTDEIMQRLEKIIADIQVDPKLTSRALRKLKCAQDDRTSARNVGLLGIFLLVGFGGIVILLDCTRVFQNVTRIRKKIRV